MLSLTLATALVAAPVVGALAHELTHSFVAEACGAETVIDVWALECHYDNEDLTRLQERAVGLAPAVVGWAIGIGAYLTVGLPTPGAWWEFVPVAGWASYTLLAGPADYSLRVSRGEEWFWTRWDWGTRRLHGALASGYVGLLWLWVAPYRSLEYTGFRIGYSIGVALLVAAVILLVWAFYYWERHGRPVRSGASVPGGD